MNIEHYLGFIVVIIAIILRDRLSMKRLNGIDTHLYERLASVEARLKIIEDQEPPPPKWFKAYVDDIKRSVDRLVQSCPNAIKDK